MRVSTALLIGSMAFVGSSFAADDCACTCQGTVRQVSDATISRDGYFLQNGKVMVFRNGQPTEITQEVIFDNGMRMQQDGTIVLVDGSRHRLNDRQWLSMDGHFYDRDMNRDGMRAARNNRDGFFIQNGKVMQFRDGGVTELTVETRLDNGSRLLPDGTLVMQDGTRSRLDANAFISLDGNFNNRPNRDMNSQNASRDRFNEGNRDSREANRENHDANRENREANRENREHRENRDSVNASHQESVNKREFKKEEHSNPTQGRNEDARQNGPAADSLKNPTQGHGEAHKDNTPSDTTTGIRGNTGGPANTGEKSNATEGRGPAQRDNTPNR